MMSGDDFVIVRIDGMTETILVQVNNPLILKKLTIGGCKIEQ